MQPGPTHPMPAYSSFIIRFWWEQTPTGSTDAIEPGRWCAAIEHVQTGAQTELTDCAALIMFMITHAGLHPLLMPDEGTLR